MGNVRAFEDALEGTDRETGNHPTVRGHACREKVYSHPRRPKSLDVGRFLFGITLKRPEMVLTLAVVRYTPKLRVVLSVEETARLLEAASGIKYKAALSVAL